MTGQHILVVDDDLDTLMLVSMMLRDQGYRVSTASSPGEAEDTLAVSLPDLLILDVMMPGEDGFSFARRLRADPETTRIPILMFTGRGLLDDKATGFQVGADDYLTKPVHPTDLLARVRSVLARRSERIAMPRPDVVVACLSVSTSLGAIAAPGNLALALNEVNGRVIAVGPVMGEGVDGLSLLLDDLPALTVEAVRAALAPLADGVQVLPGPAALLHERVLDLADAGRLLAMLAPMAETVLLDLGLADEGASHLLSLADRVVIVTEPSREALAAAHRALGHARQSGALGGGVTAVIVRSEPGGPAINVPVIQQGLGADHIAVIPAAPELTVRAHESGVPLFSLAPRSTAAEQYRRIAYILREPIGAH